MDEREYSYRIARIDDWARSLGLELANLIESEPAGVIYHYTNCGALIGMLESGKIWATHVGRMNDSAEYRIGMGLVERLARENLVRPSGPLVERALSNFESVDTFVACYSSDANRLSQWRAYAGPGVGYCIGFKTSEMATTDGRMPLLEKVIYREEVARAVVVRLLDRIDALLTTSDFGEVEAGYLLGMLEAMFNNIACVIKHFGFEEESEYRQIYQPSATSLETKTKYRSGRYGLTPYVELGFLEGSQLPIESITIGPCSDPNEEKRALEMMLRQYGYQSVEIRESEIPLRV